MKALLPLAATALALATTPAMAQDFAITGATVATGDGSGPVENATVLVRGGRIAAVGTAVSVPAGVPVVDGRGKWVTPGIVATLTDLGIYDVDAVGESNDISASSSRFSAALDIAPVINPEAQNLLVSRAGGVTRASVAPRASRSIFAGQGALIDLGADADTVRMARAFQYVELGEDGGSNAGGSRTAAHVELRNALAEAAMLAEGRARNDDVLLNRPDAMALVPVVRGEQALYVEAHRANDIRTVLRLKAEYPKLRMVLVGATEGWRVAPEIAAAGVPVITVALNDLPTTFEALGATQSNVGRMVDAGVTVAIGEFFDMNQPRYATQQAGNLVGLSRLPGASGLTWGEALAAITSIPARISGFPAGTGTLAPGAAGDVVVWDGDPLEVSSAPLAVYIDGVEQPVDSHQSRLRDRYRDLDETTLPKAYSR